MDASLQHSRIIELFLNKGLSPEKSILWHPIAQATVSFWVILLTKATVNTLSDKRRNLVVKPCGRLIEKFLLRDADPQVVLELIYKGRQGDGFAASFKWGIHHFKVVDMQESFASALSANGDRMTFLDMVEYWDLDNKGSIRDIIMRRTRKRTEDEIEDVFMSDGKDVEDDEGMEDGSSSLKRKLQESEDAEDEPRKKDTKSGNANAKREITEMEEGDDEAGIPSLSPSSYSPPKGKMVGMWERALTVI